MSRLACGRTSGVSICITGFTSPVLWFLGRSRIIGLLRSGWSRSRSDSPASQVCIHDYALSVHQVSSICDFGLENFDSVMRMVLVRVVIKISGL
ncbi:hypothetical protein LINPERHAP1_LOCUS9659 [Linum perenne]